MTYKVFTPIFLFRRLDFLETKPPYVQILLQAFL